MTSYAATGSKVKKIHGKIYHSRYLNGITVVISIECPPLDSHVLSQLKSRQCEEDKGVLYKNTELTVLFHALHADICSKLTLPGSVKSTGVTNVDCHYYNRCFNIVFTGGKGTGSAARKIISEVFRYMKPHTLGASYDMMIRSMGLKPKKEEFKWCVNQINTCLKSDIHVFVVGKINLGKTESLRKQKLTLFLEVANKKFSALVNMSGEIKPESLNNPAYKTSDNSIAVSGINGHYLQQYIEFLTKHAVHTELVNQRLVISTKYEQVLKKLKQPDKLKRYVEQKYGKTKDGLTAVVLKSAADNCAADAKTLMNISSKVLKPADVSSGMLSALQ